MKDNFKLLLDEYLLDGSNKTNVNANYYDAFIYQTPSYLYSIFSKNDYKIKASVGNGYRSNIPWLCIFDRSITTSATKGIFICYLFKKDMSGFYLTLMQGYKEFEKFGKNKRENA